MNKNLAYLFLVASKEKNVDSNVVTDSRGFYIKDGTLLPDLSCGIELRPVFKTKPAYLLVVDCSNVHWGLTLKR